MDHYKLAKLLLSPSLLSGISTIIITFIVLTSAGILYVTENQLFYDYLFGPHGVNTVLLQAPDSWSAVWNSFANGPFAYYILLGVASILGGLLVWILLQGISNVASEINELKTNQQVNRSGLVEELSRLALRAVGFLTAAVYLIFFVNVITPFDMLLLQHGIDALDGSALGEGVPYIVLAAVFFMVCLHVHVILARLYTLRPRLFGGWDADGERL